MDKKLNKGNNPKTPVSRICIQEFLFGCSQLTDIQKSAFKTLSKKEWMTPKEWQQELSNFLNKK